MVCLALAVLGALLPYSQLAPYFFERGANVRGFLALAGASPVALAGWLIVLSAALVMLFWVGISRSNVPTWARLVCAFGTVFFGPAFSLPLFLFFRDRVGQ
jgi:hypothetical protein